MMFDVSGLTELDTSGLTPLEETPTQSFDTSGLTELDTSGLTELNEPYERGGLGAAATAAGTGLLQSTLGTLQAAYRLPETVGRFAGAGADLADKVMNVQGTPIADYNPLRAVQRGAEVVARGPSAVAEDISRTQAGLTETLEPFRRLAAKGQSADIALSKATSGDFSDLGKVLTDPEMIVGFMSQSIPSLAASYLSGGSLKVIGALEGLSTASDAADYERKTGVKMSNADFAQAVTQTATINALLERSGLDSILKGTGIVGALKAATKEGVTEAAQQLNTNAAKKYSYDPSQDLGEGVLGSAIGGAGSGGIGAGINSALQRTNQGQQTDSPPIQPEAAPAPPPAPAEAVFQRAQQQTTPSVQGAPLDTSGLSDLIDSQIEQQEAGLSSTTVPPVVQDSIQTLENLSKGKGPQSATIAAADPSPATVIPQTESIDQAPRQGVYTTSDLVTGPFPEQGPQGAPQQAPIAQAAAPSVQTTNVAPPAAVRPNITEEHAALEKANGIPENMSLPALGKLDKKIQRVFSSGWADLTDSQYTALEDYSRRVEAAMAKKPTNKAQAPTVLPTAQQPALPPSPSYVVVDKQTGDSVMETFERKTAEAINREKYDVLPAKEYLEGLNQRGKESGAVQQNQPIVNTPVPFTTEQTAAGEQAVLQGAERISDRELAERRMEGASKAKVAQKAADDGLFDVGARSQTDLMDMVQAPQKTAQSPISQEGNHRDVVTQIMRERGTPMLDLNRKPTGWIQHEIMNNGAPSGNIALIHPTENIRHEFTSGYPRAGAEAQAFAIDNPVTQPVTPKSKEKATTPEEQGIKVVDLTKSRKGQKKAAQKKPLTLLQFIAKNGGINDSDIADIGKVFVPGYGRIASKGPKSKSADDMAGLAWDAGYFGMPDMVERPTPVELSDLVERSISGQKHYSEYDRAANEELSDADKDALEEDRQDMLDTAERYGIDTKGKTDEQIIAAITAASETNAAIDSFLEDSTGEEERMLENYYARFNDEFNDILGEEYEQNQEIDESLAEAIRNEPRQEAPDSFEGEDQPSAQSSDEGDQTERVAKAGAKEAGIKKPIKAKKPDTRKVLETYFKTGAKIKSYGGDIDTVVSFDWNDGNWYVRVKGTDGRERTHGTMPTPTQLKAAIQAVSAADQVGASLITKHEQNINRLYDGEMTADEARAAFKEISENEEAIKAELNKKTMKELSPRNLLRLPKPKLVNSIYRDMLSDYIVKSFSWDPFSGTYQDAIAKQIEKQTDADIKEIADKRKARMDETKQAIEDPKTLSDFSTYMRLRRVTEATLPPELKARYDELIAQRNKEARARDAEKKSVVKAVDVGDVDMEIVETKHTQKGHDLFVVKLSDKLPVEKYRELVSRARQLGGYYSSYRRDGAIPGFQFKTREEAEKFTALKEGDVSKADVVAARKEEAKLTAAQRLQQMADEIDAKADESMNRDRLTNTAKRARQAGYADDEALAQKALAQTMRNIASAIEDGNVKHLDGIRSKAAIETLESLLRRSHYDAVRQKMKETGENYEKLNAAPFTEAEVDKTTYPYPHAHRDNIRDVAEAVKDRSGFKRLAAQALKDAEEARRRDIWQIEAKTLADQERMIELAKEAKKIKKEEYAAEMILKSFDDYKRLQMMGLTDLPSLRAALREYLQYRGKKSEKDRVKELERGLIGQKVGIDFFPTPKDLSERMAEIAGIGEGARVLEPSAGNGNIADALRETGATVEVAEISKSLRDILEAKGYQIVSQDFMDIKEGGYDAVVMNPPFSNNQDIEHVRHAYDLVKDGGKVVAIVGEGAFFRQGKTETAFRDWLDELGAEVETLPQGTFQDKKLMNTTGANARLVTITKGGQAPLSLAQTTAPTFYSQLQRSIESLSQAKGLPEQWQGIIKNLTQKGVKSEEIEWSGVDEWLASQSGPVTRQEVLDYLRANDLQIKEVVKGDAQKQTLSEDEMKEFRSLLKKYDYLGYDTFSEARQAILNDRLWAGRYDVADDDRLFEVASKYRDAMLERKSDATKFSKWQLSGDKTGYRELLLTLPETGSSIKESIDRRKAIQSRRDAIQDEFDILHTRPDSPENDARRAELSREDYALSDEYTGLYEISRKKDTANFKSPHFDEPNIVAHIRFNERTDADGKRVLFIEEIQSDWHQAGRKYGYQDPKAKEEMRKLSVEEKDLAERMRSIKNASEGRNMTGEERVEFQRLQALAIKNTDAIIDLNNKGGVSGVPDAPFKTTWPELAFKRAIRYAAEKNFDRVAWTTGEQQAERYDLSKSVEVVEWFRNKDGSYDLVINTKGANADTIDFKNKTPSEIEDIIGKEATKKIEESAGEEFEGRLAGELSNMDLKVGGAGMKGFYDSILPKTVNKLVKKWDGKVSDVTILTFSKTGREPEEQKVHSLDITHAMKESVMQGLALFQNQNNRQRVSLEYVSDLRSFERFAKEDGKSEDIHETIGKYLLEKGKDTDNEYAVLHDAKTGEVISTGTSNQHGQIDWDDKTGSLLVNQNNAINIHHNHTEDSVLSPEDLMALSMKGVKSITSHSPNGSLSHASLTPYGKSFLSGNENAAKMERLLINTAAKIRVVMEKAVDDGKIDHKQATKIFPDLVSRAIEQAGVIDYVSSHALEGDNLTIADAINAGAQSAVEYSKTLGGSNDGTKTDGTPARRAKESGAFVPTHAEGLAEISRRSTEKTKGASPQWEISKRNGSVDSTGKGSPEEGLRLSQNNANDLFGEKPKTAKQQEIERIRKEAFAPRPPKLPLEGGANGSNASWDAPEPTALDSFIQKVQNKLIDLKRAQDAIEEVIGTIHDSINPYVQEELYHGRVAKRVQDFSEIELKGLTDYMAANKIEIAPLEEYLHALHAPEANKLIAERNPEIQEGGSGMTDEESAKIIASKSAEEKAALDGAARMVRNIIDKTNDAYVDYGLISKKAVDQWRNMFKHYIPLMRDDDGVMGTGSGFSIRGKEVKHRTGSTKEVVNILGNIALQREKVIVRGEKNRVGLALAGLVALNPNPSFWHFGRLPTEPVYNEVTGLVEQRPIQAFKDSPNIISVKIKDKNGEIVERAIVFNRDNPRALRLAMALKNLDVGDLEGFWNVAGQITRYFSAINTNYNPAFGPFNLIRDVQSAAVNLSNTELAGSAKAILNPKRIGRNVKEIYKYERARRKGKAVALSEESKMWEELQDEGGMTGFRDMYKTSGDRAKAIQRQLTPNNWKNSSIAKVIDKNGNLTKPIESVEKAAGWMGDWLSDYNQTLEAATRLSVYMEARKKGLSKTRAASLAKNATVNFNRRGALGAQIGSLYAFFNASIQGTSRMGQTLLTMKNGDIKTLRVSSVGKKIIAGGMLLGAMQAVVNAFAFDDDDDPPQFIRERNLVIPLSGGHYATFPLPLGYNLIFNLGRIPAEWAISGGKNTGEHISRVLSALADTYNPIGSSSTLGQTFSPTILDPFLAISENKDWTGRPIAKEDFNKLAPTPGFTRAKDNSTVFSKVVAEAINTLTFGDDYTKGFASPTPDQLDYLVGQATGGAGRTVMNTVASANALITDAEIPLYKIPIAGRLIGKTKEPAAVASAYYRNVEKMNVLKEVFENEKDQKVREKYKKQNPEWVAIPVLENAEKAIKDMKKYKKKNATISSNDEEKKRIDDKITETMMKVNDIILEAKKRKDEKD